MISDGLRVYIGGYGNEKTTIYEFDSCADFSSDFETSKQVSDPNTLSSTESRPFWITWDDQNVDVGRGDTVEKDVIASHVYDVSLPIGAIFVAGVDSKSFELNIEDETYCPTSTATVNPTLLNTEPASFAATNSVSTETGKQLESSNNKPSVESTNAEVSSTSQNTDSSTVPSNFENSSEATYTEIKSESTNTNIGSKLDDAETSLASTNTDSSSNPAEGFTTWEKGNNLATSPVQELSTHLSSTLDFQWTLTVLDNTYPPIHSTTSSVDNTSPSSPQYTSSGLSDETSSDSRPDASTSLLESTIMQSGNGADTISASQDDTSQEPQYSTSLDSQDNTSVGWPDNTSQVSQEYTSEVPQGNTSTDGQNIAHGTSSDNTSQVSGDYKSTDSQNSATATVSNSPSQANGHSSTFSSAQNASPGPHANTPAVSSQINPASSSTDTAITLLPPKHQQSCCHCIQLTRRNSTQEKEFADASEAVVNDLKVPKHNVSARIRKKTSAKDDRISSKALGYLGAFLCAVPLLVIVAGDVMRCFRGFCDKDDDVNIS
ncbi:dentin sialophosphoprotein-like [Littorina saxatilis]|uniref:dentin sialophosphoprotein-like n=1 Tax=Littorina saxatilis TaxID=31220 RepID=UPI0038B53DE7